jgi:DNA modification methylase
MTQPALSASKITVVRRRLDALTIDPSNARKHGTKNLDAIKASLARFGQVEPILVQRNSGRVIGGNGRVAVLREMGAEEADVVELDVDDLNATALGIALNRSSELAEWDEPVLAQLLTALQADPDFDHLVTGFSDAEIARLQGAVEGNTDPDAVPELPANPVTKPGDLWVLDQHRLVCGDSTNADDVARLLDGERPFMAVVDPPYGVAYDPAWRMARGLSEGGRTGKVQNDDRADWTAAYRNFAVDVIYVWHASLHAWDVAAHLRDCSFEIRAALIWRKSSLKISRGHYHWQHEPCFYAVRSGKTARWCGDRSQSTVWDIATKDDTGETNHGTQKPVEAMERPMRNHGEPGDLVTDFFMGSGSSLIAAERARRRCVGMEIDPAYVDQAVRRWEQYTGRTAERRPA